MDKEPKPLTKEQREYIDGLAYSAAKDLAIIALADSPNEQDKVIAVLIRALSTVANAEAYWREAVKNAKPHATSDEYVMYCAFCEEPDYGQAIHKPDCPWLLAQG